MKMAMFPHPKLAATPVALLLIITIASSSREMPASPKEVGYLGTNIIIEDGKTLVVKPEPKLVQPVIKEVTDEQTLKCIVQGGYYGGRWKECCSPCVCKVVAWGVARCACF